MDDEESRGGGDKNTGCPHPETLRFAQGDRALASIK
jgi:hypothetical protein